MTAATTKKHCKDCGLPSSHHIGTWLGEFIGQLSPPLSLPRKIETRLNILLERSLEFFGLIKPKDDFALSDIQVRSACFIEEARKRGVKFKAIWGPLGYTNHFCAETDGRIVRFESLPTADFAGKNRASFVDCKERTKTNLRKGGFPIAEGRAFWFWQRRKAVEYGTSELGCPLVVKPRGGSVSRHVTTNIKNEEDLKRAIDKAVTYSPAFIIERFVADSFVHRATVIDFDYVACVKQIPANVTGDGRSTIEELVKRKNENKGRGESDQKGFTLYKLVIDSTTEEILTEKGYDLRTVPREGEDVYLQENPFLKLGGDLVEVTEIVHPDNTRLFKDVAKFFDIRVVGIDFIAPDISCSWKTQPCAVLELNSVPCIELHRFPSSGTPQNVARAVTDLFFKYYL